MKSNELTRSPLLLFGPRGAGKTSALIRWLISRPAESKLKVFLCANRLARHQASAALDVLTNGNLLGYNCITYYELIGKVTGKRGWGTADWSDFSDPSFLDGLAQWLNTEVATIAFDQAETLKEALPAILATIPNRTAWAISHSTPEHARESTREDVSPNLRENFVWMPKSDRPSNCEETLAYSDTSEFWNAMDAWIKSEVPEDGFDPSRAWSKLIVLGRDLGYSESLLKNQISNRYKTTLPEMWISGLSKGRTPKSTELTIVRQFEAYSIDTKSRLIIRADNNLALSDSSGEFPTEPILKGQVVTQDFIQSMSVRALNEYELFFDGRQVVAIDISVYGESKEWWVEIMDCAAYRRVSPLKLKWLKKKDIPVEENRPSAKRTIDVVFTDQDSTFMAKLKKVDKKLLREITAKELGKLNIRYKGKCVIVVDVCFEGAPLTWWVDVLFDDGQARVHPNLLTFR